MKRRKNTPDFPLFIAVMALLAFGVLMVFSASAVAAGQEYGDPYFFLKRQLIWTLLGLLGMFIVANIDYRWYRGYVSWFMLGTIVLLVLVLVMGKISHGAIRWLGIGDLRFQPSELAKLIMVLYLARFYSRNLERTQNFRDGVLPNLIVLAIIAGLILLQKDLGTTIVLLGTTFIVFFVAGVKLVHLFLLVGGAGLAVVAAIYLEPFRVKRFFSFLDPWSDPLGGGFQIIQSLLAIGSGGLFGVGFGESKQKFFYLPAMHTDFIYAIIAEEWGFVGAFGVILFFAIFVWRGAKIALGAADNFGRLLAIGITSLIGFQAIVNMAVVTGSIPVTGITLPFVSYGGSSLLFTLIGVGVLLNISRTANFK